MNPFTQRFRVNRSAKLSQMTENNTFDRRPPLVKLSGNADRHET